MKPKKGTYAPFFEHYINMIEEDDVKTVLQKSTADLFNFLDSLPEEKGDFSYEENKWSLKEVLLHLSDAERIFGYRALRFARNDKTPLLSFDENEFIENAKANNRSLKSVIDEFKSVRNATMSLYNSFDEEELVRVGSAGSQPCTALACGFIIAGHLKHHMSVITDRYILQQQNS